MVQLRRLMRTRTSTCLSDSNQLVTHQPLVKFGALRTGGESKSLILSDEHVYTMAEFLPKIRDAMCNGDPVGECKNGAFRLKVTRSRRMARLYLDTQYITLALPDLDYLARMFQVLQQQLREYILALPDVLSYVTASLTSVTYVEPAPNASRHIDFPHLYEELIICVNLLVISNKPYILLNDVYLFHLPFLFSTVGSCSTPPRRLSLAEHLAASLHTATAAATAVRLSPQL